MHTHAHTHTHTHTHSVLNSQTGNWVKIYLCCSCDYSAYENSCPWAVAYYWRYVQPYATHHMAKIVLTNCMLFSEELIFHMYSSNIYTYVRYQKCLQTKLSWHLRKLSSPSLQCWDLYAADNEHTYQDCEYIIRTKHVVYESKFLSYKKLCELNSLDLWRYCTGVYKSVGHTVWA